jgi:type II secretion system protein N
MESTLIGAPPSIEPATAAKKAIKILAYISLFLAALLFFVAIKLPDSLVANALLNSLNNNTPYRWTAEKISTSFLFVPHVEAEKITMEGKGFGGLPPFTFDTLKVYPTLWTLLPITGSLSPRVSFSGSAYQADLKGAVRTGKNMDLTLDAGNVDLAKLKPLQDSGIDLKGLFTKIAADLSMENNDLSLADGTIDIQGKNFVIDPSVFSIPLPLPIMDVGTVEVRGKATKGKVELERVTLGSPGKDLEVKLTGDIKLNRTPALSMANLRLLIKPSAKVMASMPSLKGMLSTLATALPDGFYAMRFTGPIGNLGLPRPDK